MKGSLGAPKDLEIKGATWQILWLPSRSPGGWQGDGAPILQLQGTEFHQKSEWVWKDSFLQRFQKGRQPGPHLDFNLVIFLWCCQHDLWLLKLTLISWMRYCLWGFSTVVTPVPTSYCFLWGQSGCTAHMKEWGGIHPFWGMELPQVYVFYFYFFPLYCMVTQLPTHVYILFSYIIMLHHSQIPTDWQKAGATKSRVRDVLSCQMRVWVGKLPWFYLLLLLDQFLSLSIIDLSFWFAFLSSEPCPLSPHTESLFH